MRERWFSDEFLRGMQSFVLSFKNIVDYINWVNPIVDRDARRVRRGLRVWERIRGLFREYGWPASEPPPGAIVLGGVYDGSRWRYRLLSDKPVRIPYMPSIMVLEADGGALRFAPGNRRVYVGLLKLLIKAVIVRT